MTTKFFEIEGQVLKRITNPARKNKNGEEYRINYLVVNWITSGQTADYEDPILIKCFEAKKIADVRAGYMVKMNVKYSSRKPDQEISCRNSTYNEVTDRVPNIFGDFSLPRNSEIEVVSTKENWEQNEAANEAFEKEVVKEPEPEDDLPF